MQHRSFTILSGMSLALFAVVMVMWVRSDDRRDALRFQWHGNTYAIASEHGQFGIDNSPAIDDFRRKFDDEMRAFQAQHNLVEAISSKNYELVVDNRQNVGSRFFQSAPSPVRHTVPYWIFAAAAAVVPFIWAGRFHRRRIRQAMCQCIAFGCGDLFDRLAGGARVDLAFEPSLNEYNGYTSVQLEVKDIQLASLA